MLSSILTLPLHPAVVHVLTALAVLLPFLAVGARWAIRRGSAPLRAWGFGVALLTVVGIAAPLAVEIGESPSTTAARAATAPSPVAYEEAVEGLLIGWICLMAVTAVALRPRRTA